MRSPSLFALALALVLAGPACHESKPVATPLPSLAFYAVSEEPIEGGRFIDLPGLPKVGYVASAPHLVVTSLDSIITAAVPPVPASFDKNGDVQAGNSTTPALLLKLHPTDMERLRQLAKELGNRRILVALNNEILMAPSAASLFRGGSVLYPVAEDKNRRRLQDELEKMEK
jgi:hypothetical protein